MVKPIFPVILVGGAMYALTCLSRPGKPTPLRAPALAPAALVVAVALELLALRRGAPTRPALTGAVAGLLSAGTAASLYALHCPDDSPLFVATWYVIASSIVAMLGAVVGAKVLRL